MSKPKVISIKRLEYNFIQVGSIQDNAGAGSDYDFYEVGKNCIYIDECKNDRGDYYMIEVSESKMVKVFNPNKVIYELKDLSDES